MPDRLVLPIGDPVVYPVAEPVAPSGPDHEIEAVLRCPRCPSTQWAYRLERHRNINPDGTPLVSFRHEIVKASADLPDLVTGRDVANATCPDCGAELRRERP